MFVPFTRAAVPPLVLKVLTPINGQQVVIGIVIIAQQCGDRQHKRLVLHNVSNVATRQGRRVDQLDDTAGAAEEGTRSGVFGFDQSESVRQEGRADAGHAIGQREGRPHRHVVGLKGNCAGRHIGCRRHGLTVAVKVTFEPGKEGF